MLAIDNNHAILSHMWGTYKRTKASGSIVWLSKININKKQVHNGTFETQAEAHKASVCAYERITGNKWETEENDNLSDLLDYNPITGVMVWKKIVNRRRKDLIGRQVGTRNQGGYLAFEFRGKFYSVHRVAWLLHYREWPKGQIDHINGNRTDNRILNLRDVSKRQNMMNQKEHREGKLWGTTFHKSKKSKPYSARILFNGKNQYLGFYDTPEEAHERAVSFARVNGIQLLKGKVQS